MGRNIFKQITALTCGLLIAACLFLLPSAARAGSGNVTWVRDTGGIRADQAFMGYFRRLSRGGIRQTSKGTAAGDKLQGADARLYAALKTQIENAAGTTDGKPVSTRFKVSTTALFDRMEYTFAELGFADDLQHIDSTIDIDRKHLFHIVTADHTD